MDLPTLRDFTDDEIKAKIKKKDFSVFQTTSELKKWLVITDRVKDAKAASAWINSHIPHETDYQSKILEFLKNAELQGNISTHISWKDHSGQYQRRGIPDICAIIDGKFFGFEVKRPLLGVTSDLQLYTLHQIKDAGGVATVVSYTWEVEEILRKNNVWLKI